MRSDSPTYFELKSRKAVEQGKTWWFEARLTDEEANLRPAVDRAVSCSTCRYLRDLARHLTGSCLLGHSPNDCLRQVCDEWRYFA